MIRFAKRLIGVAACIVVALVLVRFGPTLWVRIFGGGNTQWISERFSETLREMCIRDSQRRKAHVEPRRPQRP